MKKLYPNLGGWLTPLLLLSYVLHSQAQEKATPALTRIISSQITFIVHAPVLLPEWQKQQRYDRMKNFLGNWKNADYPSRELILGAEALLAVETGKFSAYWLPCDCLFYLSDYSRELRDVTIRGSAFRYYVKLQPPLSYDATENARAVLLFLRSWAFELLQKPGLDADELFICHSLAGDIPDPKAAMHTDPQSCPRLTLLQKDLSRYNNQVFTSRRDGKRPTAAVMVGWWAPTGHLQTLGSHPSVGVQLGGRNKWNEYDVTWSFRFGYPTPVTYTYMRMDTLYHSNYYDGGYFGFEYTRYFVHQKRVDLGFITGIGYDYFSIADGWSNHPHDYAIVPINVGSFDWNNGLRLKYFLQQKSYIGLMAKYHLIHYDNPGGTNLAGNAFTLDLSFCSH